MTVQETPIQLTDRRTDREARLAVSERRYRSLIDAVHAQAVWVANPAGERLDDAPRFRQITGQSFEEYRGRGWSDPIHPMDREDTKRKWAAAFEQRKVYETRYRLRTAAGRYRWFAAYGVPVVENDVVIEWVGTITDIHAQKILEDGSRVLRHANELFTSTLDESIVLQRLPQMAVPALADWCTIDLLNEDGTFARVGVGHADSSKVDVAAQLLQCPLDLPPAVDGVQCWEQPTVLHDVSEEMLASYATNAVHLEVLRGLGIESIMTIPMSVRGKLLGVIRMFSCESQRHYGEEELELATEVARRAATAIDNARLYAQAADANRAKDIFLATLSHEMKTPLTAILGWSGMLKTDGPASALFDEALEAIEQSARVQERLIDDVLDVSRVITGKLSIERKQTSLHDVIRAAVEIITPAAQQKDVHLRVHETVEMIVNGDETRLRQVVWNLLTNAVKFTPAGGFVEIFTAREQNEARLTVRDSGRGMRADMIPHVFDQFHQNTVADRVKHHGLGLGLAIVRHLVLAHGGRVEAQSAGEGKGSEFVVTLPLFQEQQRPASSAAEEILATILDPDESPHC
jgi:PAS domain S-box-containing protein